MRRIETLVALAACACMCAALSACAAAPVAREEPSPAPEAKAESAQRHSDSKEVAAPAETPLHEGKEEVTVLVLNGCGIEGAAEEAAEKIRGIGFEQVAVGNATYFDGGVTRVSYRHEEQRAEVDEIANLFEVAGKGNVYNYGDTKDWGREYDILVMVGDPSAAGNPVYVSDAPNEPPSTMRTNSSAIVSGDSFAPLSSQQSSTL